MRRAALASRAGVDSSTRPAASSAPALSHHGDVLPPVRRPRFVHQYGRGEGRPSDGQAEETVELARELGCAAESPTEAVRAKRDLASRNPPTRSSPAAPGVLSLARAPTNALVIIAGRGGRWRASRASCTRQSLKLRVRTPLARHALVRAQVGACVCVCTEREMMGARAAQEPHIGDARRVATHGPRVHPAGHA